jgi:hypothetical protein
MTAGSRKIERQMASCLWTPVDSRTDRAHAQGFKLGRPVRRRFAGDMPKVPWLARPQGRRCCDLCQLRRGFRQAGLVRQLGSGFRSRIVGQPVRKVVAGAQCDGEADRSPALGRCTTACVSSTRGLKHAGWCHGRGREKGTTATTYVTSAIRGVRTLGSAAKVGSVSCILSNRFRECAFQQVLGVCFPAGPGELRRIQ